MPAVAALIYHVTASSLHATLLLLSTHSNCMTAFTANVLYALVYYALAYGREEIICLSCPMSGSRLGQLRYPMVKLKQMMNYDCETR